MNRTKLIKQGLTQRIKQARVQSLTLQAQGDYMAAYWQNSKALDFYFEIAKISLGELLHERIHG